MITTTQTAPNAQNTFYMINAEQLKEVVQGYLEELLVQLKQKEQEVKQDRLLTCTEVMDLLKCSRFCLWNWEKKGLIKGYRLGKRVSYKESEVKKLIENR